MCWVVVAARRHSGVRAITASVFLCHDVTLPLSCLQSVYGKWISSLDYMASSKFARTDRDRQTDRPTNTHTHTRKQHTHTHTHTTSLDRTVSSCFQTFILGQGYRRSAYRMLRLGALFVLDSRSRWFDQCGLNSRLRGHQESSKRFVPRKQMMKIG